MEQIRFQRRFRFGYDPAEVDAALGLLQVERGRLEAELAAARARCSHLEGRSGGVDVAPLGGASSVTGPLRRAFMGFRRADVRELVERLDAELARVRSDRHDLSGQLDAARAEIASWHDPQSELQALALRAAEDAARIERRAHDVARARIAEAERSAWRRIEDARSEAASIVDDARARVKLQRRELRRLAALHEQLSAAMRGAMVEFDRTLAGAIEPVRGDLQDPDAGARVVELAGRRAVEQRALRPAAATPPSGGDDAELRHVLDASPLADYADLARLVRRLEALEEVDAVHVQSFEGETAQVALHVAPGAALDSIVERLEGVALESHDGDSRERPDLLLRLDEPRGEQA